MSGLSKSENEDILTTVWRADRSIRRFSKSLHFYESWFAFEFQISKFIKFQFLILT